MSFDTTKQGIITPFRRDQINDFASGTGRALVVSQIEQILGVRCSNERVQGEYPWNPSFGSLVDLLRHRNINDDVTQELARTFVVDAISKWTTAIRVTHVQVLIMEENGAAYRVIRIGYQNTSSNERRLEELDLRLPLAT